MARTPAQRGKIGNWLVESRLARGWGTQAKARVEIERLTGWRVAQSVYAEWESGRRVPSDANLERLREFYGGGPTEVQPSVGDSAAIVAAIGDLVAAVDRQTKAQRDEMTALGGVLAEVLVRLAAAPERTPSGSPDPV